MAVDIAQLRARLAASAGTPAQTAGTPVTPSPIETKVAQEVSQVVTPVTPEAQPVNRFLETLQRAKETISSDDSLADSEKLQKEIEVSELLTKIDELDVRLKASHPLMPTLLREIHTTLRKQPDNITLLEDEQIAVIVRGLLVQTTTTIATKKATSKKSTKSITIEDL